MSPPLLSASPNSGTLVARGVTPVLVNSLTSATKADSLYGFSVVIFKSEPTVTSTVFSSTKVPV